MVPVTRVVVVAVARLQLHRHLAMAEEQVVVAVLVVAVPVAGTIITVIPTTTHLMRLYLLETVTQGLLAQREMRVAPAPLETREHHRQQLALRYPAVLGVMVPLAVMAGLAVAVAVAVHLARGCRALL